MTLIYVWLDLWLPPSYRCGEGKALLVMGDRPRLHSVSNSRLTTGSELRQINHHVALFLSFYGRWEKIGTQNIEQVCTLLSSVCSIVRKRCVMNIKSSNDSGFYLGQKLVRREMCEEEFRKALLEE